MRMDIAYGWPWLSFRGGYVTNLPTRGSTTPDFGPALPERVVQRVSQGKVIARREPRTIPLHPLVPGLLANTGVYGAAWFALLAVHGRTRRWRRRRRGACVACGYDRRGLGAGAACPECGKEPRP